MSTQLLIHVSAEVAVVVCLTVWTHKRFNILEKKIDRIENILKNYEKIFENHMEFIAKHENILSNKTQKQQQPLEEDLDQLLSEELKEIDSQRNNTSIEDEKYDRNDIKYSQINSKKTKLLDLIDSLEIDENNEEIQQ